MNFKQYRDARRRLERRVMRLDMTMTKQFSVTLLIPVTLTVSANNDNGEVTIMRVHDVALPSIADISDALDGDNLRALDDAFNAA